jgi:hypothetical protein
LSIDGTVTDTSLKKGDLQVTFKCEKSFGTSMTAGA